MPDSPGIQTDEEVSSPRDLNSRRAMGCMAVIMFGAFICISAPVMEPIFAPRPSATEPFVGPLPPEDTELPLPSVQPQGQLPPEGRWLVTYTPGGMVCPGVIGVPALVKEPHEVTISHEEDESNSFVVSVPGEGDVTLFPGVLPESPQDVAVTFTPNFTETAISTQDPEPTSQDSDIGTVNPAGVSVDSQSDLLPHPTIFTGTAQAGLTITYQLEFNQGNRLWGISENPSENDDGGESDTPRAGDGKIYGTISNQFTAQGATCYIVVYAEMVYLGE